MSDLQKLVLSKLQEVLSQQQLQYADIGQLQAKIGNNLKKALEMIFSFYEDMNIFNECMIDQLMKQKHEAKMREIIMLHKLSSIVNSQKYMEQKGRDGQINLSDQQIVQFFTHKIQDISNIIQHQYDLKSFQISEQKQIYEDQLRKDKEQIEQLKKDMSELKATNDRQIKQLIKTYRQSQQQQKKALKTEMHSILSQISHQQKENISKLYDQQRHRTLETQQALNNLTKYICELMKSDEIYQPQDDFEKWMNNLKVKVEKYRRQIQISTGKKNSWQEKNSLKQILYHQTSKLINRNYRLAELKGK